MTDRTTKLAPEPTVTMGSELFAEFLQRYPTLKTAAKALNETSASALISWRNGTVRPKTMVRKKIAAVSGGLIPEDSWLTDAERAELKTLGGGKPPAKAS